MMIAHAGKHILFILQQMSNPKHDFSHGINLTLGKVVRVLLLLQ
jgi:hypothetical protein